jgi:hypothetical protein
MSEELIIEQCSPTLAGIKTGSLFSVKINKETDVNRDVREINNLLRDKGLRMITLKKTDEYALIYLYRPSYLKKDLKDPLALSILKKRGYAINDPEWCIAQLVKHLNSDVSFPHEIGLFLGYPPSDVECFMKSPNEGVKCCGWWRVYSEPEKAKEIFDRFRNCTKTYKLMNKNGKSLAQLAVMTG